MRIYFCSDLHASRRCWKKFLNSWRFYGADHIIVGGDITGKFVVPIVAGPRGTWSATYLGVERRVASPEALARLETWIADAGQYSFRTTPDEREWYGEDQSRIDGLFRRLAVERVVEWVEEAEAKLAGAPVRVFLSAGNDDFFDVDDAIAQSTLIEDPNERLVELDGGYEILGMGWGNLTPWRCPRDIPEDDLARRIDKIAARVRDPRRTIFSLHVPPWGSGLDAAPQLDERFTPSVGPDGVEMTSVGSTATKAAILRYRPLLGLHGHVHESKGVRELGGVLIANPGSEYSEGILTGVLVDIDRTGVRNLQLVSG